LSRRLAPQQALVNLAGERVLLTFAGREEGSSPRTVTVKTLRSEHAARYREWVEAKRARVHAATGGRIGYIHIPNMGPDGYAEFHRAFLAEVVRQGLIVDVRYNGGGHVSQLLLEKLARRRIGYDVTRWGMPESYPAYAVLGPLVAIANEWAGSDGDIFNRSRPSKWAVPCAIRAGGTGNNPISESCVTDLPDPDSPTTPRVSPGNRSNETPSTAVTRPWSVVNSVRRSRTDSNGSLGSVIRPSSRGGRARPAARHQRS
jgi:hypothetical protein